MSLNCDDASVRMCVEPTHVMMFARAIGDLDAQLPQLGSESVPVTFPVAVAQFERDYELRPSTTTPWFGSGATAGSSRPSAVEGTRLHAEQHFEYHRPIRVGEDLFVSRVPGEKWTKASSRGGELEFFETLTHVVDADGDPVVTMKSVSVIVPDRGVA